MDIFQLTFTKDGETTNVSSFPEKINIAVGDNINSYFTSHNFDCNQFKLGVECKIEINNSSFTCVMLKFGANFQILGRNVSETNQLKEEIKSLNKISDLNMMRLLKTLDELKEAKKSVDKTNKFREEFISNVSHEMRTPLTAVMGFSEILLDSNLTEDEFEYVKMIKKSSDDLLIIISDLLDISSISEGKIEISESIFDLKVLSERAFKNILQLTGKKNLTLKFDYKAEENTYLIGDKVRLIQILFNLLSNSVKYTKEGSVTFIVNQKEKKDNNYFIEFIVKDTGIGIDDDKIETIFNEFYQVKQDNYHTPLISGLGLGLSIVKRLVTLMGGEISVQSKIGKGSEFTLTIPFKTSKKAPETITINAHDKNSAGKKSALIVEDIKTNQMILRKILQNQNINVSIVNNGKEAIDSIKETSYDIIFMDIQMPILNGEEATKIIRNDLNIDTPIIAITAHAFEGVEEKCLEIGMNGFITKPFDQSKIVAELENNI